MTTLPRLWQKHHRNKGNNSYCNNSKDACESTATMPSQQGKQCHHNDGKDTCPLMMTMTPLQQGQQSQLEDGNDAIVTSATMPLWIMGKDTSVTRGMIPS
jgi:hypothetical protein